MSIRKLQMKNFYNIGPRLLLFPNVHLFVNKDKAKNSINETYNFRDQRLQLVDFLQNLFILFVLVQQILELKNNT